MNPKPIIENGEPSAGPRPELGVQNAPKTMELPIAAALPAWDLVPSDAVLVRRRPVKK